MIDTHVHLNHESLERDLNGVLQRAQEAGITTHIVIGFDLPSSRKAVELAERDARLFAVVGIHPHDASAWNAETAAAIAELAAHPRVVGIGEAGLDFYRDLSPRDAQFAAFRDQIALARASDLPLVVHCRDAYPETLEVLEAEAGDVPILLHCFAGNRADAERAWARNWYLGVGGTLTYKKNDQLREIVRDAPQECLLLETDAPYLSPEPLRGKFPNEPARVALVAGKIAALRGETLADVAACTDANAYRIFPRLTAAKNS